MAETPAGTFDGLAVTLTVDDLEKSIDWWKGALGFTEGERMEEEGKLMGIELRSGAIRVYLGQDDWKRGRDRKKGEGWRMYLHTSGDVDAIAARAKTFGAHLDSEPRDTEWKTREFSLTDPTGFKATVGKDL